MTIILIRVVIALAAAARSTWSPCGLSMLSQITPLAEAGRQHKFARTAGWFIAGSVLGGLALGCAIAGAAIVVAAVGLGSRSALALIAGGALAAAATDAHLLGFGPPFLRRQVNEAWLSTYRAWVYGSGFGFQIGAGVTTYVMTAAVPLMIAIGAFSANAWVALGLGALFGLARGLAVLLGARIRSQAALFAFHRRFDAWTEPIRRSVIGVQVIVAIVAAWVVAPALAAALAGVTGVVLLVQAYSPRERHHRIGRVGERAHAGRIPPGDRARVGLAD
jgi:hypothetical protein